MSKRTKRKTKVVANARAKKQAEIDRRAQLLAEVERTPPEIYMPELAKALERNYAIADDDQRPRRTNREILGIKDDPPEMSEEERRQALVKQSLEREQRRLAIENGHLLKLAEGGADYTGREAWVSFMAATGRIPGLVGTYLPSNLARLGFAAFARPRATPPARFI